MKNSANEDTIRRRIKETLEYLAFLRLNEEYVFGRDDQEYFGSGWNGLLIVQDLQRETVRDNSDGRTAVRYRQLNRCSNDRWTQPSSIVIGDRPPLLFDLAGSCQESPLTIIFQITCGRLRARSPYALSPSLLSILSLANLVVSSGFRFLSIFQGYSMCEQRTCVAAHRRAVIGWQ